MIKSSPFGGDKPGFLIPVPRQFMLYTEQVIYIIKCNLIKCTWKEKRNKKQILLLRVFYFQSFVQKNDSQEYS